MPEVSGEYAWMGAALQRYWGGEKRGYKEGGKNSAVLVVACTVGQNGFF